MSLLLVLALEVAAYALLLAFFRTDDLPLVLGYIALFAGTSVSVVRIPALRSRVLGAFTAHKRVAAIGAVLLALTVPVVLRSSPYWIFVIALSFLYVIVALGLNLQTGTSGLFNLSGAALYGAGAYVSAMAAIKLGLPGWLSMLLGALAAVVISVLLFIPVLKVRGHYLALVTIAFGVMFNIMLNNTEAVGGPMGIKNIPGLRFGALDLNKALTIGDIRLHFYANYYVVLLVLMLLAILVVHRIYNSPVGLTLNAIRDDQWAARTAGINVVAWKLIGFCTGSALIGLAGAGYAHMVGYIAPDDFSYSSSLFMMSTVILGGMDSIPGVSLAALLLVIITEKLRVVQEYRFFIYGIAVVAMMLFRPKGIIPAAIRPYFAALRARYSGRPNGTVKGGISA